MALESLMTGTPAAVNGNNASQTTLPDWYNNFIQGIAAKGANIAARPYQQYPGQQLADFNNDQQNAFQQVRSNMGNYQPALTNAGSTLNGASSDLHNSLAQIPGLTQQANSAVSGPAQSWTSPGTASQYMSPYTSQVTDEIARLGDQNIQQNILPGVTSAFTGAGQFGSTRNAQILGQNVRDAQLGISGLQSQALQAGYGTGAQIFGADANRAQAQGQLQANTALGSAGANTTAGQVAGWGGAMLGGQQGSLGQLTQQLGNNQATALGAVGAQQQSLEQQGYNTAQQNFSNNQNWDWSQLGKLQGTVSGAQLPVGQSGSTSQANTPAGTSPLGWLNAISGLYNATQTQPNTTTNPGTPPG